MPAAGSHVPLEAKYADTTVAGASAGEPKAMAEPQAENAITSVISDVHDLPLDANAQTNAAGYSRIMRLIGVEGGGPVTPLAAFQSSI